MNWQRMKTSAGFRLAGMAAALLCLGPLTGDGHAAHPSSWRANKLTAPSLAMPLQVKAGFQIDSVSGPSGQPLPLRIELPENPTAAYSFLMFRNLPANFRLSAGFGTKTYWAVSINDSHNLQIIPPDDYVGTLTLEVLLIKTIGSDPERVATTVTFQPAANRGRTLAATPRDSATAALPETAPAPKPPSERLTPPETGSAKGAEMTPTDRAMMERGNEYMQQGDVASARLLYLQLARRNIAEGAYAMGSTYDPEFLATLRIRGLKPDVEEARKWYEKARALGSPLAARRLSVLRER